MKRILIFSLTYFPYVGGAEVAMKEITDRLDPNLYAFDMITLRFDSALPKVEKVGNITVHRIGPSMKNAKVSDRHMPFRLRFAKAVFPITAFFNALSLDSSNVYNMTWALMANQSAFAALFFKCVRWKTPYFLELQDGRAMKDMTSRRPMLAIIWPLYRSIYIGANKIKAISQFIAAEVKTLGYKKEIVVIPNAVDVAKFSAPVPEEKLAELRTKFGKKDTDVFLFTASRLVLSRGVEDSIRALSFLPSHVKLLIAGGGEDQDKLQKIVHDTDLVERVIFAGHIGHEELPALYQVSDIFVRPSIIEGFGNAFVEAFAAGIPVVATPVGGIPDFLTDGETGLFCKVNDPKSVAEAVQKYLDDSTLRERVVANAKKLVAEKYDWQVIAADMERRVFEPLLAGGRPVLYPVR